MTSIENGTNVMTTEHERPKTRKKLIISLAAIVLVLLIAGGGFTAYAKFDVFKSPKLIYLEAELKNLTEAKQSLTTAVNSYNEDVKPFLDKPLRSTFEISDFTVDAGNQDGQVKKIMDLVKKSKLTIDNQQDAKAHKSYMEVNWNVGSDPLIGIEAAFDPDKFALRVPTLFKKYGYVNVKDMDTFKKDFNAENLPKKIITYEDLVNAVKIPEGELNPILLSYGKLYVDNLNANQITLNKNGMMEEEQARIASREVTVTFSESDVKRISRSIVDKLEADKVLQDILFTRFKNVRQLLIDSGTPVKDMDKDDFSAEWKRYCEDMRKSVDKAEFGGGMTMVLYIDSNDKILERKISFDVKPSGGDKESVTIKMANWPDKNFPVNELFSFKTKSEQGDGGEFKWLRTADKAAYDGKGKLSVSLKEYGGNLSDSLFALDADYDITKSKDKDSGTYNFKLSIPDTGMGGGTVNGSVKAATAKADTTRDSSYEAKLFFSDMKKQSDLKGLGFKLHSKQETVAEVKMPELTKDNSIDLVNMSEDQKMELTQEIGIGVQAFMEKNKDLVQSLGLPGGGMNDPY